MTHPPLRHLLMVLCLAPALAWLPAGAAEPEGSDRIATPLNEARARYAVAIADADAALLKAFERQINAALNRGDVEASRRLEAARARFKSQGRLDTGNLPVPLKRAGQDWTSARKRASENWSAALDRAIRAYAKARQLDQVEALQRERDSITRQGGATNGLVLHLSFEPQTISKDGEQVKVKDLSGNGNDGVQRGTVRPVKDGRVGSAAGFDGRGGDVSCGNGDSLRLTDALTVAAFARPNAPTGPVVGKEDWKENNHARGFVLRFEGGKPEFAFGDGGPGAWHYATARGPVAVGRWYHLAGTFDGRQLRLYVDGREVATDVFDGKVEPSPFPLVVGRGTFDRTRIFTGDVDELTVFDRALSADEIRELARAK